jgi:DNA-binding transcriptional ArsR family regulator
MTGRIRQISDSPTLSAMSHPLRRRLLDVLKLDGPATVGMLAERTGEGPGNISHHVRVLAEADLIAEAPELARDRRERWWRRTADRLQWSSADFADDAAADAIARAAQALNLEQQVAIVRAWAAASADEQARWPTGPFSTDTWMRATDEELAQLAAEVTAVIVRWAERPIPDDGQERSPVFAFALAVPGTP